MSDMTNKTLTLKKRPCSTETPQQTTISFRRNRKTIVHVTQTPTRKKKKPLPQPQKQPQAKIKSKPPVLPKEKQKKPVKAPPQSEIVADRGGDGRTRNILASIIYPRGMENDANRVAGAIVR